MMVTTRRSSRTKREENRGKGLPPSLTKFPSNSMDDSVRSKSSVQIQNLTRSLSKLVSRNNIPLRRPRGSRLVEDSAHSDSSLFEDSAHAVGHSQSHVSVSVASMSSTDSILSAWSNDDLSVESCYKGMERIQKKLEMRERKLRRLLRGKGKLYAKMMMANEQKCRDLTINKYKHSHDPSETAVPDEAFLFDHSFDQMQRLLLFELYHSAPALFCAVCGCLAYASSFLCLSKVLEIMAYHSTIVATIGTDLFYVLVTLVGLVLMRLSGYIWSWTGHESYDLVKFEMHNRANLGYLDTRLMAFLKKKKFSGAMSLLSFNVTYTGASFFYYKLMERLFTTDLEDWWSGIEMEVKERLPRSEKITCDAVYEYVEPSYRRMIAYIVCFDGDWSKSTVVFHFVMCLLFVWAMRYGGLRLRDM